jgi:hypothetical protein
VTSTVAWAGLLAVQCLLLTGCLRHTRAVPQMVRAGNLQTSTLGDLVAQINRRDEAIHSLSLTVTITASVGGAHAGKVTDYTSLSGYILLDKPDKLRVLGLVPVLHNKAFDMASNGDTFELLIPAKGKFIEGSNKVVNPSANALENLRPFVFTQSLLVGAVPPADFSYVADETHFDTDARTRQMIEKRDYDVGVLHRMGDTNQLSPRRIIHIGRQDLLPYQQDLYDDKGAIETQAYYSDYRDFNGVQFPATIRIRRPQEEYEITLTIEKLTANLKLANDQFDLSAPAGVTVQKLP